MPRPQRLHPHSLETYREEAPVLGARASMILNLFRHYGAMTDREVMRRLGYHDPNTTRPRVTELIQAGVLREVGQTIDSASGKAVRVCAIVTNEPEQLPLFQAKG